MYLSVLKGARHALPPGKLSSACCCFEPATLRALLGRTKKSKGKPGQCSHCKASHPQTNHRQSRWACFCILVDPNDIKSALFEHLQRDLVAQVQANAFGKKDIFVRRPAVSVG